MRARKGAQNGRRARVLGVVAPGLLLCACSTAGLGGAPLAGRTPGSDRPHAYNAPYVVHGRRYMPADQPRYDEVGLASWYGYESGRRTSDGEPFGAATLTAAHRTLPIPSLLEVTNLDNGRRVEVRLNDRGPFAEGRLIDVSRETARQLGFVQKGVARVRVRYLGPASAWPTQMIAAQPRESDGVGLARQAPRGRRASELAVASAADVSPLEFVADLPTVTATARSPALADATPAVASAAGGLLLQAGAFSDRVRAQQVAARLGRAGPTRIALATRAGRPLYRVLLGPLPDSAAAEAARSRAVALGLRDARVVAAD